jgi:hypothetical protein
MPQVKPEALYTPVLAAPVAGMFSPSWDIHLRTRRWWRPWFTVTGYDAPARYLTYKIAVQDYERRIYRARTHNIG